MSDFTEKFFLGSPKKWLFGQTLYIRHANFGNAKKLEKLLEKYNYEYKIVVQESSTEVLDVEFFMYEARLIV